MVVVLKVGLCGRLHSQQVREPFLVTLLYDHSHSEH
jgi:hypothetical protein